MKVATPCPIVTDDFVEAHQVWSRALALVVAQKDSWQWIPSRTDEDKVASVRRDMDPETSWF